MNDSFKTLLLEIEQFGIQNDSTISERAKKLLNITADTGTFLALMVHICQAKDILEIGTSNGYSTLHLAYWADKIGGHVHTIEHSVDKINMAKQNFKRATLDNITQIQGDAGHALTSFQNEQFKLIFLDAERIHYVNWWPQIKRIMQTTGLVIVDNALSHPQEIQPLYDLVSSDPTLLTSLINLGKGELLISKL